jgi:hypothetical protein
MLGQDLEAFAGSELLDPRPLRLDAETGTPLTLRRDAVIGDSALQHQNVLVCKLQTTVCSAR